MAKRTGALLCPDTACVRAGFFVVYVCLGSALSAGVIRYTVILDFWIFIPKLELMLPKYEWDRGD